ncbi:hypothetical protein K1719_011405 [Acacia pycnantha]|nr:hypothetical protein K1719_011405 [Acacia pycnantha]
MITNDQNPQMSPAAMPEIHKFASFRDNLLNRNNVAFEDDDDFILEDEDIKDAPSVTEGSKTTLPTKYYKKGIIRAIGRVLGKVIRIDYNTTFGERDKFARMAIILDLSSPLMSKITVDEKALLVEYEGLMSSVTNAANTTTSQTLVPKTNKHR